MTITRKTLMDKPTHANRLGQVNGAYEQLNDQTTTTTMASSSGSVAGNVTGTGSCSGSGSGNASTTLNKLLPGKSLKYEKLINQTATMTVAGGMGTEAATASSSVAETANERQHWRLTAATATATTTNGLGNGTATIVGGGQQAQEVQKSGQNSSHNHQQEQQQQQQQWQWQQSSKVTNVSSDMHTNTTNTAASAAAVEFASNFNNGSKYFGNGSITHATSTASNTSLSSSNNYNNNRNNNNNTTNTNNHENALLLHANGSSSNSCSRSSRSRGGNQLSQDMNSKKSSSSSSSSSSDAHLVGVGVGSGSGNINYKMRNSPAQHAYTTTTTSSSTTFLPSYMPTTASTSAFTSALTSTSSSTTLSASTSASTYSVLPLLSSTSPMASSAPSPPTKSSLSSSSSSSLSSSTASLLPASSLLPSPLCASSAPSSSAPAVGFGAACNCCNLIARFCFGINVRRCVLALFAITVVTIFYYTHYVDTGVFVGLIQRDTHPAPIINCRMVSGKHSRNASPAPDHRSEARLRIDPKVLVFVETTYSSLGRDIAELLVYNRIKYKIEVAGKSLPVLTNMDKGRYGVIVFENLDKYLNMDKWNRELLDKYCREYDVGIVGFVSPSEETLVAAQLRDFPLFVHTNLRLRDASLNPASTVLRLTRAGETAWGALPGDDWAVFQHNHSTYTPIEWAQRNTQDYPMDSVGQVQMPLTTVLQDRGQLDGIQRVLFGSNLRFWLHRLVFLDALSYLSHGQLSLNLERMLLVDIDDIFVGEKGTRLRPDDVRALIATQKIIAAMVPGFKFNLGFSGKYYHHGTREENLGDDFLLQNVHEFNWFSHMWKHQQPHLYDNLTLLISEMQLNYGFAKEHDIPTDSGYSISPHHSGVYPAHELLYVAWKKVWNVKVTSTEEYPHLRPARLRRGFIHRNIMVLPRQTCGLFTHTMYIDRYPGGRDKLDESIQGGELFQTIVYNPINIFMTHMSNYGSDRLALYTFQSVIKFLQCWTNLKLASAPPIQLAETYFRLHPEEVDPVWGNPCDDVRHKKIWSKTKNCDSLPKFLVIGPQKTGTTALYTFLAMHPGIASNIPSPYTYEEVQFFNGNNYYRGLDWYMDFFPSETTPTNTTSTIAGTPPPHFTMFEKSATYFDGEMVPKRAHALLPHAKIVTILVSPAKRAYSWYQHQRAHGDVIANNYSFYQVITATDSAPKALKDLRNRCLNPGKYAQHLEHWLAYYPAQQLHIIDGEQLRLNPVDVMNELQRFLKIQPPFDYSNHLRYDVKKGFYCQIVSEKRNKCLGKSKGRQYPAMDERSGKLLQRYYLNHNTALVKLLKKLGSRPIPQWLKDDLSTGT